MKFWENVWNSLGEPSNQFLAEIPIENPKILNKSHEINIFPQRSFKRKPRRNSSVCLRCSVIYPLLSACTSHFMNVCVHSNQIPHSGGRIFGSDQTFSPCRNLMKCVKINQWRNVRRKPRKILKGTLGGISWQLDEEACQDFFQWNSWKKYQGIHSKIPAEIHQ